jgi:hypothetical protein
MLAVIVAGCSNGSAGTATSATTSARTTTATAHGKAVKFAECMRSNGVSAFPDPDASGELTIDAVANNALVDTSSAAFARALGACKHLQPPGFTGGKVTPSQRSARLEFAQCVRENGVPDFPDPTSNGPIVDTNRIPSSNTAAGMTLLNAAMHTCGARLSGRLGLKGQ